MMRAFINYCRKGRKKEKKTSSVCCSSPHYYDLPPKRPREKVVKIDMAHSYISLLLAFFYEGHHRCVYIRYIKPLVFFSFPSI